MNQEKLFLMALDLREEIIFLLSPFFHDYSSYLLSPFSIQQPKRSLKTLNWRAGVWHSGRELAEHMLGPEFDPKCHKTKLTNETPSQKRPTENLLN
jgi:hypothetical protein